MKYWALILTAGLGLLIVCSMLLRRGEVLSDSSRPADSSQMGGPVVLELFTSEG